jgi:hypothetical protein
MASTGKIVEVLYEQALETFETQDQMLDMVSFFQPEASSMQNSENFIWRPVEQHAPIIEGWDITGKEQEIIEETYPAVLGTPKNDFVKQRADQLRDMTFWHRRGKESGRRQASNLNQGIVNAMMTQGSMFYKSAATSGYPFIAEAQALMNERQGYVTDRCFLLNDRSTLDFSADLAARQTLQGRPEDDAWVKGQIGSNVAEFNVYTGSYLPTLVGGASPATTVTGDQSFKPEGGSVDAVTGVCTNVDYRQAVIPVAASASYNIGDKVTMGVNAVGLDDKTPSGLMTFTIVAKPSGTSITVYPKPIAADDVLLSDTELAYANIDTTIVGTTVVARVNTDATARTNLFWDKDAVEVLGGTIPAELFTQFDGMKVMTERMKNGLNMYMVYDGNINDMSFRYRLFTWYGITIKDPSRVGIAIQ